MDNSCKKILILGKSGLLGKAVFNLFKQNGYNVVGKKHSRNFDMTNYGHMGDIVRKEKPWGIINCAGFADVEACEYVDSSKKATNVNGYMPISLMRLCLEHSIHLIHISTDYVFSNNRKDGYDECYTKFSSMNNYGRTKQIAEKGIIKAAVLKGASFMLCNPRFYIVRTQWLFGFGAKNFIAKITEAANKNDQIKVVDDEFGCPTYVKDVACSLEYLFRESSDPGIYHVVSSNSCSRLEFAKEILQLKGISTEVRPIKLKSLSRNAGIPKYSILTNTKLPEFRTWQEMLADFLS